MMKTSVLWVGALIIGGCVDAREITLEVDDGSRSITYNCRDRQSRMQSADNRPIIADYVLRIARVAAEQGDQTVLEEINGPYEARDWVTLEHIADRQAAAREQTP